MKIKDLLKELKERDTYAEFIKENPDAFFCSGMFILGDADKVDLNFFIPSQNKISSFSMPFGSLINHQEEIKDQEEIKNLNLKVDLDNLREFVEEKTERKADKIIAVLQKDFWNITCLTGLSISRMNIKIYTGEVKHLGTGSIMDMIRFQKGNRKL